MAEKRTRKNKFVKAWIDEHVNDHWVKEATRLGYRSRAAFKLIELLDKDRLFRPGMSAVDLGAAPGSWTQVLRDRLGRDARIVALDILEMAPLSGVRFVKGDFREPEVLADLESALGGRKVDLVVSDLAPNLSGVETADQARSVLPGRAGARICRPMDATRRAISWSRLFRARDSRNCKSRCWRRSRRSTRENPRRRATAAARSISWQRALKARGRGILGRTVAFWRRAAGRPMAGFVMKD